MLTTAIGSIAQIGGTVKDAGTSGGIKAALGNILVSAVDAAAGIGILSLQKKAGVSGVQIPVPTATQIQSAPAPASTQTGLIVPVVLLGGVAIVITGIVLLARRR